jgi:Fe2+ or Zn2+ uptake regulation protein
VAETYLERELRGAGGRVTPQRRLIAGILQEQGGHLSAEEIYLLARRRHSRVTYGVRKVLTALRQYKHFAASPLSIARSAG